MARASLVLLTTIGTLTGCATVGPAAAMVPEAPGTLSGQVTDVASGGSAAGVTVLAQGPGGERTAVTDEEGRYTIPGLAPGAYAVRFYFTFIKVECANVQVVAATTARLDVPMNIEMARETGTLSGSVTDAATGGPVAGVTVVAQGPAGEHAEFTDGQGRYTIQGLVPGTYAVHFYFANIRVECRNVPIVASRRAQLDVPISTKAAASETYSLLRRAPSGAQ